MEELRKWLSFGKGERIAIISILACIIVLVMLNLFHRPHTTLDKASLHNLDSLLALRQSKSGPTRGDVRIAAFPFQSQHTHGGGRS